jgi:hypothetical protein
MSFPSSLRDRRCWIVGLIRRRSAAGSPGGLGSDQRVVTGGSGELDRDAVI